MEIHELNTKSMTNPAYCALDDGSDTYKLDLNAMLDTMNTDIESDISAVDTKVQKKTRIWYASVSSQTGTPNITISGYDPGDNDYLVILFQFGNTSIKDVHIGAATYDIWYKGANTVVKADGGERVLYRIRTNNVVPYRLEYVGNHYDLATTSAKGLMSAADKAALDQAVSDVSDIQGELPNKADKVGSAPDLIAGLAEGLNTDEGTTIEEPYNLKVSGGNGREKLKKIVGVSVGWNQQIKNTHFDAVGSWKTISTGTLTVSNNVGKLTANGTYYYTALFQDISVVPGHKYIVQVDVKDYSNDVAYVSLKIDNSDTAVRLAIEKKEYAIIGEASNNPTNVFYTGVRSADTSTLLTNSSFVEYNYVRRTDLTIALGSTIADYVYSLEQATTGAGMAWLKTHFPKMFGSYQPYDAGSIQSVTGLSAHVMRNADDEIIGTYPLDDSLTLRGILKLDANNSPYADGDIYEADGTVTRRYGIVDLGTLTWTYNAPTETKPLPQFRGQLSGVPSTASVNVICSKYVASLVPVAGRGVDKTICVFASGSDGVFVCDSAYSTAADFKAAVSGVMLVYEKGTPETETAEPYTESQIVDGSGTEEFVSTSIVPVGNETFYLADLKGKLEDLPTIPEAPTTDGTYVLKATVSGGVASYSWVSE